MDGFNPEGEIISRPNVRAERKAATRHSLIRSAQTLFAEKGYQATTLEEIAAHAGLHVQTLYRHFANKVELVTAGDEEKLSRFRVAIRNRDDDNTTFDFWAAHVAESAARVTEDDGGQYYRETRRKLSGDQVKIAVGRQYEQLLAESLQREFPQSDAGSVLPLTRLAAIALWRCNTFVVEGYSDGGDFDFGVEVVAAVRRVEEIFLPLLKAGRIR